MEELSHMSLLTLHLSIPQVFVTFATTPEYVVFCTQALCNLQRMLQLTCRVCINICKWWCRCTRNKSWVSKQGRSVPQKLDSCSLHILFNLIHYLIEVCIGFTQGIALWSNIAIMEAEILRAQLSEEFEGVINLSQGFIHWIRILAIPRTMWSTSTEWINQVLIEGVPPCHTETQPILHLLARNNTICIVVTETKTLLNIVSAHEWNLFNIPQTHYVAPLPNYLFSFSRSCCLWEYQTLHSL